jgi:hypothetical protein
VRRRLVHELVLVGIRGELGALAWRENGVERRHLLDRERDRKVDVKLDNQIALVERALVGRHALALDDEPLARLDDDVLGRAQHQLAVVQVLLDQLDAAERVAQVHGALAYQIVALALEARVLLLLQHQHHIAGLLAGRLVGLAAERDLLAVLHALLDEERDGLALDLDALALAAGAPVGRLDDLALALALRTRLAHLLHQADAEHHGHAHHNEALAAARVALGRLLAALAAAQIAHHVGLHGELGLVAVVQLLQRHRERLHDVFAATHARHRRRRARHRRRHRRRRTARTSRPCRRGRRRRRRPAQTRACRTCRRRRVCRRRPESHTRVKSL